MEIAGLHWLIMAAKTLPLAAAIWLLTKTDWRSFNEISLEPDQNAFTKVLHKKKIVALLAVWLIAVLVSPVKMADDQKHMRSSFNSNDYDTETKFAPSVKQEYSRAKVESEKEKATQQFSQHQENQ